MSLRFVANVGEQPLGPLHGIALASFIGCHGGIAGTQVLCDDMRPREFAEEAADPNSSAWCRAPYTC